MWGDRIIEKRSVLNQLLIADLIFNATCFTLDHKTHFKRFTRFKRGLQSIRLKG